MQEDLGLTKAKLDELIILSESQKVALNDRTKEQIGNYKKAVEAIELIQQGVAEKNYSKIGEGVGIIRNLNFTLYSTG